MKLSLQLDELLALRDKMDGSGRALPTFDDAFSLCFAGTSFAQAGLVLRVLPSLPLPHDLGMWRRRVLARDLPTGTMVAVLTEDELRTPAGWPVTTTLAAVCRDPNRAESCVEERLGYFFSFVDTAAEVVLYVRDRAAFVTYREALQRAISAATVDWEDTEPATLAELWAQPKRSPLLSPTSD